MQSAPSFVDNFSNLDRSRWFVSDGWNNGNHQNCTWSKDLVRLSDGVLSLSFEKRKLKDREFACAEIQTKQRYGYGVYEARMKTDSGSGLNAAFFTYIGPQDKKPWDEIDFEVLTKDPSKVQVNSYIQGKPKNGKLVDVEGGADKGFNDYGFVWEKDRAAKDPVPQMRSVSSGLFEYPKSRARVKNCSAPSTRRAASSSSVLITPSSAPCSDPIRFWPPSPRVIER